MVKGKKIDIEKVKSSYKGDGKIESLYKRWEDNDTQRGRKQSKDNGIKYRKWQGGEMWTRDYQEERTSLLSTQVGVESLWTWLLY